MTADHERIWLQNEADATSDGRLWCQDKVWPADADDHEPTEYVRADLCAARLHERLSSELPGEYDGLVAVLLGRAGWSTGTREAAATAITTLQSRLWAAETDAKVSRNYMNHSDRRAETAEAKLAKAREALEKSISALSEAADDIASWGAYASDYFREKHDLAGEVSRVKAHADSARSTLKDITP